MRLSVALDHGDGMQRSWATVEGEGERGAGVGFRLGAGWIGWWQQRVPATLPTDIHATDFI